ncbi:MAG: adenosylcobinamide-GDP ribazoletransferase [Proteobacteria bacterium]|nr:adenosylcobinamide-GDP ribazoletransferase [Pseudomonadota bacterium]
MEKLSKIKTFLSIELAGWWRDCCVSGAFLTRLPFPSIKGGAKKGRLGLASRAFPLVGAGIGAIAGLSLMAATALGLDPLACALIALAVAALVTGALHEDGLADVADGFGGGATMAAKLKIMHDSRIGTFGVLAVIFSVGIRAGVLAGLPGPGLGAAALIAAAALSRGLLPAAMHFMTPARKSGLAANAGAPDREGWMKGLALGALLSFLFLGPWGGVLALAFGVAAAAFVAWLANRQIGGVTGDVLGAQQQAAETVILIAAAAAL